MEQEKVHVRLLILAGVAFLWMTAVFGRLTYLQLIRHSEYMSRAMRQQRRTIEIDPKRGTIYDRNMRPLAMSVPVQSAFAIPSEIKDTAMAARLLTGVLRVPPDALREKLESGSTFVWIKRKMAQEEEEAVRSLNLKGIYFQEENKRYYPKLDMAAHVLGFVDVDEHGLGGIEYEYDNLIRGKGEKIVVMADARQQKFDGGEARQDPGESVVLTLDEKIQYIAERELAAVIQKVHAPAGSVIVQDPNTGAILALANWPKYNPNSATSVPTEARMDRAVSAIYEPGSTFKLVTLAAAFDQNLIRPEEVFNCENGSIVVAGHRIHDHKKYGELTVAEILANSSDVGAIKIALKLGPPRFNDYIHAFGFGSPTGVDLPGESRGLVQRLEHWGSFSIGSISMGQEVGVTPLQMVNAVSAVANGGLLYKPRVVVEMRRGEQVLPLEGPSAPAEPRRVIRPETAATMRRLMEGVILNGTGKSARLDGWTAGGKTGTAQKIDPATGRYSRTKVIASFTGFAPINNPAVTILVSVDSPEGWPHDGASVSAPVFKRIAEQVLAYLDVPRDVPLNSRLVQTAYRQNRESEAVAMEDDTPMDFSAPAELTEQASKLPEAAPVQQQPQPLNVTVTMDEGGDIAVPDFKGKTMREVADTCMRLGLNPVLVGSSLAMQQTPAAGSKVRRGAKIRVEFGTPPVHAGKTH
ncbi:MAG TPA: penicillin-binding protein [Candidatus Acidoferrales bacterium]|jgi:cell division protein FtsI (penicillin-binding protein 3)|nr:penicillin-binding protein [Candidatus Acidoferrales bacterium]